MRPNEHIPSCFAIANPGTGRASPAGREPNPILIAEHRSHHSQGGLPGDRPLTTFRGAPTEPLWTRLPGIVLCPWALSCNYAAPSSDAGGQEPEGWQQGAMRCSARGTTAPLRALQSEISPAMPISGCIPSPSSCPPLLAVTTGPHREGVSPIHHPLAQRSVISKAKGRFWGFSINRAPRGTPHPTPAPQILPSPPKQHQHEELTPLRPERVTSPGASSLHSPKPITGALT